MIIYKVTNKINEKIYIGQTSQGMHKRRQDHISDALLNNNDFSPFHRAVKKYGKENFEWEILENCESKKKLDERERHYIKCFKSHVKEGRGYNATLGGGGCIGVTRSLEYRKKQSLAKKGKKVNLSLDERQRRSERMLGKNNACFRIPGKKHNAVKKYVIITPNGEEFFIEGINDFCRMYNRHNKNKLYASCLVNCASGKGPHHKWYKCRYYNENMDYDLPRMSESYEENTSYVRGNSKKYVIIDSGGNVFVVCGLTNFCNNYSKENLSYTALSMCANGRRNHHKGYKCRYYDHELDCNLPVWGDD